jgi:hypothetical protein
MLIAGLVLGLASFVPFAFSFRALVKAVRARDGFLETPAWEVDERNSLRREVTKQAKIAVGTSFASLALAVPALVLLVLARIQRKRDKGRLGPPARTPIAI